MGSPASAQDSSHSTEKITKFTAPACDIKENWRGVWEKDKDLWAV